MKNKINQYLVTAILLILLTTLIFNIFRSDEAWSMTAQKTMIAGSFIIEDENGKMRCILSPEKLEFFDSAGVVRCSIYNFNDSSLIALRDPNSVVRLALGTGKEGSAYALYDSKGRDVWSVR